MVRRVVHEIIQHGKEYLNCISNGTNPNKHSDANGLLWYNKYESKNLNNDKINYMYSLLAVTCVTC